LSSAAGLIEEANDTYSRNSPIKIPKLEQNEQFCNFSEINLFLSDPKVNMPGIFMLCMIFVNKYFILGRHHINSPGAISVAVCERKSPEGRNGILLKEV
jgi:hypothetical protein